MPIEFAEIIREDERRNPTHVATLQLQNRYSENGDHVLGQVTSKPYVDSSPVKLDQTDFVSGSLEVTSYVRPGKLLTASTDLITSEVGALKPEALTRVVDAVVALLRPAPASSAEP